MAYENDDNEWWTAYCCECEWAKLRKYMKHELLAVGEKQTDMQTYIETVAETATVVGRAAL